MIRRKTKNNSLGFTLVELLVVVSIMAIIMGVIFFSSSNFSNNLNITNQVYEMALTVREAQTYGLSVKNYRGDFDIGYGVHFEEGLDNYSFFVDQNKNHIYEANLAEPVPERVSLEKGNTIYKVCRTYGYSGGVSAVDCSGNSADISFLRPDPDAYLSHRTPSVIYTNYDSSFGTRTAIDSIIVVVKTPDNLTKQVEIYSTGQISISNTNISIPSPI